MKLHGHHDPCCWDLVLHTVCALCWIYWHWWMMGDTPARLCVDQPPALGVEVPCTFGFILCIAWDRSWGVCTARLGAAYACALHLIYQCWRLCWFCLFSFCILFVFVCVTWNYRHDYDNFTSSGSISSQKSTVFEGHCMRDWAPADYEYY